MACRKREKLKLDQEEMQELQKLANARSSPNGKVRRAQMILLYAAGERITDISRSLDGNRPLIERTIDKALRFGAIAALDDLPRSGRPNIITDEAVAWVLNLACQSPQDFGYPAETWTYSALIRHIKIHCLEAGFPCLENTGKGALNKILAKSNIKPHKISYYLEKRDPEFDAKMATVLCVYQEVGSDIENESPRNKATVSYDEKPGIQALKNIAPQLNPVPGKHRAIGRDYEYKRLGTVTLLAGLDLHTGKVIPLVRERHCSKEFTEFLELLNQEYDPTWKLRIVLDNHSAHTSKETQKYLASKPNRFEFVFTPKHGSWLNMIEMFFSKASRSFLRHIRVNSKAELMDRIYRGIEEMNLEPVIFRWKYKMEEIRTL
jgi:transposase